MGKVAGEQGLAYSVTTSDCHKISSFNDGGFKFGHFDVLDMLFPFLTFFKLWPIIL